MGPESKIEAYLKKRVLADGAHIRKLTWPGHRGAPDRMIWWPSRGPCEDVNMIFVEVKAPGKKATKQQEREHKRLRGDGFVVRVVSTCRGVDNLILDLGNHPWGRPKV